MQAVLYSSPTSIDSQKSDEFVQVGSIVKCEKTQYQFTQYEPDTMCGAFGAVGFGACLSTNKSVAIKVIKSRDGSIYLKEVENMRYIKDQGCHPNILHYYDSSVIGSTVFIVMEQLQELPKT